jgi:dTMP kinase
LTFIVIDGIDGCGKSSHAKDLVKYLRAQGRDVIFLKEPTAESPAGKELAMALKKGERPSPEEELRLFIEDRKWDVENRIMPAMNEGKDIVMDRYYYSTVAYQGARGMDIGKITEMNEFAPRPDLAIILDIDPETAGERISRRGNGNYFEKLDYLREVRELFLSMKDYPEVVIIDSSGPYEETKKRVEEAVKPFIP